MKGKILVTGGTGYIGSHTAVKLIEQGYEVHILDNLVNSSDEVLKSIKEITGVLPVFTKLDLTNEKHLQSFFQKQSDFDAVIHFAALKAVGESVQKPIQYYKNNLLGMLNLVHCMEISGVENIVFSSSATVYGIPDQLPITESEPTKRPTSPYGNTKKISEEILQDITSVNKNFGVICLRYFNPIGAHPSGLIGELPNGVPNNLMPFITQVAIGKRDKLMVFGDDYNTSDGTAVRDYIHVMDLADAHVMAIERLLENKQKEQFELFNLGTGQGSTVLDVIKSFEKATSKPLPYEIVARRQGDVPMLYADTRWANEELKWKSTLDLDDMTTSSWNWEVKVNKK